MGYDAARLCKRYLPLITSLLGTSCHLADNFSWVLAKDEGSQGPCSKLENICLRPGCGEPTKLCCARCKLALYCCSHCLECDRYRHSSFCLTAGGFPADAGYNPEADADRTSSRYGKLQRPR